ncbi:DUF3576 domain-containing protein [Candidatus Paracaedibacter symbiosus]|uniref:DUF3576 domain-containing protein n=1 Tax=Candidatus Paracaedibacter symbiosus TaxID=244582 RepID=UPI000509E7C2|nr:DUF3576 domain-containing protein [Candidatus Paracaedibacter symbiosus]
MRKGNIFLAATLIGGMPLLLVGCGTDLTPQEGQQAPLGREETRKTNFGKLFGDDFLFFGESKKFDSNATTGMRVNPYLWQASLDVLSFIPLASADANGGIIITEWYSAPQKLAERVKVIARVNDRQLRADAITIIIHKQIRSKNGEWVNAAVEPSVVTDMEDIILTKARQLKVRAGQK